MKERRDIKPYMFSPDFGVNTSLTMAKIRRRILNINPSYSLNTRYQRKIIYGKNNREAWHTRRSRYWFKQGGRLVKQGKFRP